MIEPDRRAPVDRERPGLAVPSIPRSVAVLRRHAVAAGTALGHGALADTAALLVSEVATNAVLHVYGQQVVLRVGPCEDGSGLHIEVDDESEDLPVPRGAKDQDQDGRGLALVQALASRWGVDPRPGGKTTWFELQA